MPDLTQYDFINEFTKLKKKVDDLSGRVASGTIPGLQIFNGVPYFQRGVQVGPGGQTVTEPPQVPVPTGLSLSWGSSFETVFIDVSWSAPAGYGADQIASYLVRAIKFGGLGVPIETTVGGTSARLEPVEPNTTYIVQVSAVTRTGRTSTVAEDTILTGGDTTAPGAPTFPASPVSPGILSLQVKWNPNTERDTANGNGTYRVRVSVNADLSSPIFDARQSGTNQWVGNLVGGTPYYVGINAIDSSGNQSALGTPPGGPWTPFANVTDTSAFAFGGGNIVKDSGFEDATWPHPSWAVGSGTWARASDEARLVFGATSIKVTGTSDAHISQTVTLSSGTWILSAWVLASSVASVAGGTGVVINTETISGTIVNYAAVTGGVMMGGVLSAGLGSFGWKRIALRFDVTSSTANFRFYLQRGYLGTCSGTVWFDDVQLEQGDVMTGYAPRPDEIYANTIQSTMIADDQITTPKLAAFSVVAGKVAANAIGTNQLQANSIVAAKIAADQITSNHIVTGAVTASEIEANAVTSDKINANAVTTAKLAANSVTAAELDAIAVQVGKFISSASYVPNSSGWHIGGDGNAEFNNVFIRGTLNAARFGADLFDFTRFGGGVGARFHFTGTQDRFYVGEGMINTGQVMYYDNLDGQFRFSGGDWRFTHRTVFDNTAVAYAGWSCGTWGTGAGYFIASDSIGNRDTNFGLAFGTDGGSAFTTMVQGYCDSTLRHVGLANTNGLLQQVYIDCGTTNPADTRSLTRTGWITYSDPKSKSDMKPLKGHLKAREKIRSIEPIRYKVKIKTGKKQTRVSSREHFGFDAAAMKEVVPEAVHEDLCFVDPKNATDDDVGMGIDYGALTPILWQGHIDQDEEIDQLRERIEELEAKLK